MRFPALLLACAAFLLSSSALHAQRLFDLGLKGGVNMDDLSTTFSHTAIVGGNFGVFARVKPPLLPGLQGEVLLSSVGSSVTSEGQTAELRSVDLQLPLFLIMAFGPAELHAGGYYARHLIKSIDGEEAITINGEKVSLSALNDDSYGILVGAGLRLKQFYAGARYNFGLGSIGTGPYLDDVKNRQAQLYIGWGFFK